MGEHLTMQMQLRRVKSDGKESFRTLSLERGNTPFSMGKISGGLIIAKAGAFLNRQCSAENAPIKKRTTLKRRTARLQ